MEEKTSQLIIQAYVNARTMHPDTLTHWFFDSLQSFFDFERSILTALDNELNPTAVILHRIPKVALTHFQEHVADDPFQEGYFTMLRKNAGVTMRDDEFDDHEEWLKSDMCQKFSIPFGIFRQIGISFPVLESSVHFNAYLARGTDHAPYTEEETTLIREPLVHFLRALEFSVNNQYLAETGSPLSAGTALVTRHGEIVRADHGFRKLIDHAWGKHARKTIRGQNYILVEETKSFILYEDYALKMEAHPLSHLYLIRAFRKNGEKELREKLTKSEFLVALHLSEGQSYKEVANLIGKSRSTVDNQVGSACRKLGCTPKQMRRLFLQRY